MTDDVQAFLNVGVVLGEYDFTKPAELRGGKVVAVSSPILDSIKKPWQKFKDTFTIFYDDAEPVSVNAEPVSIKEKTELDEMKKEIDEMIASNMSLVEAKSYLLKLKGMKVDLIFGGSDQEVDNAKISLLENKIAELEKKVEQLESVDKVGSGFENKRSIAEGEVNSLETNRERITREAKRLAQTEQPEIVSQWVNQQLDKNVEKAFDHFGQKEELDFMAEPEIPEDLKAGVEEPKPPVVEPTLREFGKEYGEKISPDLGFKATVAEEPISIDEMVGKVDGSEKASLTNREKLEEEMIKYLDERRDCIMEIRKYENKFDSVEKVKLKKYFEHLSAKIEQLNKELAAEINNERAMESAKEVIHESEVKVANKDVNLAAYMREREAVVEELKKYENSYMSDEKDQLNQYLGMIDQKIAELSPKKEQEDIPEFKQTIFFEESKGIDLNPASEHEDEIAPYDLGGPYINQSGEIIGADRTELDIVVESLEVMVQALEKAITNLKKHQERELGHGKSR